MQSQLEELVIEHGIEWHEYRLDELFGKSTRGRRLKSADRIVGDLPFVTAGERNAGISAWIGNDVKVFSKNTITIDMFGSAKYRDYEYGADDHVAVVHTEKLPETAALFVTSAIHKSSHAGQFDYSKNFYASDADELKVKLPVISPKGKKELALDFMDEFVNILKKERIATLTEKRNATLDAYLASTNLADYEITNEEQAALDGSSAMAWAEFKISDVFEKLNLKKHKKPFNKLNDTSTTQTDEFNLPLVNAKLGNNGVMFYGREAEFDSAEMTIDVVSNGAVATGSVYAQPDKTGVLWDAYLLKPKHQDMTKHKLLYLAASLQKSIRTKFSWEDKAVWSKVQHETIMLPIKPDKTPDYDFMSLVVSAMQKQVIKEVVSEADRVIDATSNLVQSQ